ncbi:MAG: hypothetical protein EXQ52_06840 [Bryobacterales bacterium]|nr:hypothetical protein [Bryobacterales bacterium]
MNGRKPKFLWLIALAAASSAGDAEAPETAAVIATAPVGTAKSLAIEEENLVQLLGLRRVFVDRLTGGESAAQMRDMIIGSLQNARLFIVTENQDRADAILRGSAEDLVFTDVHSTSESLNARANIGMSRSTRERGLNSGFGAGESESSRIQERKHEASSSVRLVNKDGDVIWSTTQESMGGKFRGSSADVADKITKKLVEDYERARKLRR